MTDKTNSPLNKQPKRASSAPPPIKPLDPKPIDLTAMNRDAPGPANWNYWKHVSTVELWQGLLLSLNIEPTGGGLLISNSPKSGGYIPYEYMDKNGQSEAFVERWHLLRNKLETDYAAIGIPPCIELTNFIGLPRFADIAIDFNWEPLPTELAMLAVINNSVTPETLTSDGQQATATQDQIDKERDDASVLKRRRELNSQCKAPTRKLAEELGISDARVRQIIRRAKKDENTASQAIYSLAGQLSSITTHKR